MNDSIENALRLSAYVQLRKTGTSREAAAEYAKNLTVNFNRKGSSGSSLNALLLFYNASVQGSKRAGDLMRNPKTWGYLGALAAAQVAAAMFAMGQTDDDDTPLWDKIPEHVKQRNLVFTWMDGKEQRLLTIPMPYGFNLFPYMAGRVTGAVMHPDKRPNDSAIAITGDIISTAVQSFSPVPLDDGAMGLVPSIIRIPLSIQVNRDSFDRSIRKENPFGTFDVPRASMGKPDTIELFKVMANGLNKIGGGDDRTPPLAALDWAPEDIEYLLGQLTGGAGKFVIDTATLGQKLGSEDGPTLRDVPISKRFLTTVNEQASQQAMFYDRRSVIERDADHVRDTFERDGEEAAMKLMQSLPSMKGADFKRYKKNDRKQDHMAGDVIATEGRPQLVADDEDSLFGIYKQTAKDVAEHGEAIRNAYTSGDSGFLGLGVDRDRDNKIREIAEKRAEAQRKFNAAWNRYVVGSDQ